jgi:hypothetical protein
MMNERIKELAKECGLPTDSDRTLTHEVERFAELLIRECMGVARGMRNPPNLNYKPSDRFVDELRLHFGVKE